MAFNESLVSENGGHSTGNPVGDMIAGAWEANRSGALIAAARAEFSEQPQAPRYVAAAPAAGNIAMGPFVPGREGLNG